MGYYWSKKIKKLWHFNVFLMLFSQGVGAGGMAGVLSDASCALKFLRHLQEHFPFF